MQTSSHKLLSHVYNITSFSPSVMDFYQKTQQYFPNFILKYQCDILRQKIVDSWPNLIDDRQAKNDWGWKAKFNFESAFKNYIIPEINKNYK